MAKQSSAAMESTSTRLISNKHEPAFHADEPERRFSYALITPARNESAFIENTIRSVIAQTVRPVKWIIVSDGSTDGTDEIVQRYCREHAWMELVRMPERETRQFAAKAHAFNAGYALLKDSEFDIVGNLDADITFEPSYLVFLLDRFRENPRLGVAGTPFVEGQDRTSHSYAHRFAQLEHVSGACQMFRRACFEAVGGYVPVKGGAVDWIAVTTARMKGWETRTFTEKVCLHHRQLGTGNDRSWLVRYRYGQKAYYVGGHPLWAFLRGVFQMRDRPWIIGGFLFECGYWWSFLTRMHRPVSQELIAFHRGEQMSRLRRLPSFRSKDSISPERPHAASAIAPKSGSAISFEPNHITVCVCTYRRPTLLLRLLESLAHQQASDLFSFSVVVADNDAAQSARAPVTEFAARASFPVVYCVEPQQNIALARNKAIEMARGEFIAFIDDDEFPANDWLIKLRQAYDKHHVAGVLGPVKPHFEKDPPTWIIKGRFCDRPEHANGTVLRWWQGRTGNLLFHREILEGIAQPFRPEFGTGGEDQDFYRRMMDRHCVFIWCNEAVAYETVPPARWKRSYMLKRALLRGRNSLKHARGRWPMIGKSLVAVPLYLLSLPLMLLGGQHRFMKNSVRLCDHLGRILTLLGINPVHERET